jgi:hypothetical protein
VALEELHHALVRDIPGTVLTSRPSTINPETFLTSTLPGEGVASRREGCRRGASFLFPDSDFP